MAKQNYHRHCPLRQPFALRTDHWVQKRPQCKWQGVGRMENTAPPPGRFPAATAPRCVSTNPLNDAEWGGRFVVMIGTQATLPVSSCHKADQRFPAYSQRSRVLSILWQHSELI